MLERLLNASGFFVRVCVCVVKIDARQRNMRESVSQPQEFNWFSETFGEM